MKSQKNPGRDLGYEENQPPLGEGGKDPAGSHEPGYEEFGKKPGHRGTSVAADTDIGEEEYKEPKPGHEVTSILEAHHKGYIKDAHGLLSDLAKEGSLFGEQEKMKAFMYSKLLSDMGEGYKTKFLSGFYEKKLPPTAEHPHPNGKRPPTAKHPNPKDHEKLPTADTVHAKGLEGEEKSITWHKFLNAISGASTFMGDLSTSKNPFGNPHRAQAGTHAAAIGEWLDDCKETMGQKDDEGMNAGMDGDMGGETGAMSMAGEMGEKSLSVMAARQAEDILKISTALERLSAVL